MSWLGFEAEVGERERAGGQEGRRHQQPSFFQPLDPLFRRARTARSRRTLPSRRLPPRNARTRTHLPPPPPSLSPPPGFGIFERKERAARVGRNPKTGAELQIKAKKYPAFTAGKTFKDRVAVGEE